MSRLNFLYTFRVKLLLVLAVLLLGTLSVQYYLNLQTERENAERRRRQEKVLVAGIAVGFNSLSSDDRLKNLKNKQSFSKELSERVANILIINEKWQVFDSLDQKFIPKEENEETKYWNLKDLTDLPPLLNTDLLGADLSQFPNAQINLAQNDNMQQIGHGEAHAIPVETDRGRWYVMVILKSEEGEAFRRAALPLIYTLIVLLISTLVTFYLIWRFTRPIKNLSNAAGRIAEGDLTVRVAGASQFDEMGRLTARFNEMTAGLEKSRELEAQLQQAERSAIVGRLGSAIAHEIRNPLNYINLTLDHLRAKFAPENVGKNQVFERLTSQLKTEVGRINQQITDFLQYSRPLKMNLQSINVRQVIEDSLRIVEGQAAEQNVKVSFLENEKKSLIIGDPELLRSVFNNLLVNAVQAMPDGGELNIAVLPEDDRLKITIADTGNGIAPENVPKIFEPYFSTKETGTGLGLAIVKKIVDDHQGAIIVESTLNRGTIFTVWLPAVVENKG